jgi:oxygen-independent coproporphyrinogen-3 oxidase
MHATQSPASPLCAETHALPAENLLARFDRFGPRYTSYPTADRFVEAFDGRALHTAIEDRRDSWSARPVALYVHIPFCESLCYYCACNKIVTKHKERATPYLDSLFREIELWRERIGERARAGQLHLGGGTPTYLDDSQLALLLERLSSAFEFTPHAERAIEVDPRTVDRARLERLRRLGFNRISFGVQDLDPAVQEAVHRVQSEAEIAELMRAARDLRFDSINIDLIYGLPRQTPAGFARTIERIIALRPDRVALYAYAHMPQRFKPQRRIHESELPPAADRVTMLAQAIAAFSTGGYEYVGMDHFALPQDALARAKRQGLLTRDFQGYTANPECDLIALGVSAISKLGAIYSQNHRDIEGYQEALKTGNLPVMRGIVLSRDDLVRRSIIMALMCQGEVSFESIEQAHLVDFRKAFASELQELAPFEAENLIRIEPDYLRVTELGWFFVRAIAMVFDRYVRTSVAMSPRARLI